MQNKITKTITASITIILAAFVLLAFSACSDNDQPDFSGEILTISTVWDYQAIEHFAQLYMDANHGVIVEVNHFHNSVAGYENTVSSQLMAGTADVLMCATGLDHHNPNVAQLLADWWPIMQADPNFNEDDYFVNAFHAAKTSGRLLAYPFSFSYWLVAANNTVPGLADAFAQHDYITTADLLRLHGQFASDSAMLVHENFDAFTAVFENLDAFLDFEGRIANFNNPQFIEIISSANRLAYPVGGFGSQVSRGMYEEITMLDHSQMFLFEDFVPGTFQFFMTYEQEMPFVNFRPLANANGELVMDFYDSFVLNAAASDIQKALAWDFMTFIQNPENRASAPLQSVYRPMLHKSVHENMYSFVGQANIVNRWRPAESLEASLQEYHDHLVRLGEMPMTNGRAVTQTIMDILAEVMQDFNTGLLTAEQTAELLQNRISIVLMELD